MPTTKLPGLIIAAKKYLTFFHAFSNVAHWKPPSTLRSTIFGIIFKSGKDIHCAKISDEFDYGGSAPLNMRIIDRLMN